MRPAKCGASKEVRETEVRQCYQRTGLIPKKVCRCICTEHNTKSSWWRKQREVQYLYSLILEGPRCCIWEEEDVLQQELTSLSSIPEQPPGQTQGLTQEEREGRRE